MPTPWPLSAPESLVLREGVSGQGTAALKLAVLELVGRRVLRVERERRWYGARTWVAPGGAPAPGSGPLAELGRRCMERTSTGRERLDRVVAEHLEPHGSSAQRWLEREVVPRLEARGLLAREDRRLLGLIPRTRWVRTPAGDAAATDLEGRIAALGRGLRGTADPRDALALAAAAGAGILLVHDAWPLLDDLRRQAGDGGGSGAGGEGEGLDLGGLDLDFGSVGGAVDAVDAGVDGGSGGGDGGGDGGGGD